MLVSLDVPVPAASGFTSSLQNIGKLQNRGLELSLKGDFDFSGFKWAPAFNFSLISSTAALGSSNLP